ncbi:MAG: metal ABC transporter permease [Alphaproteobacteria bacterium]
MSDDFILRSLAGGVLLSLITGPVGAFMLWRKRAFFGAAIAEGAILGVVIGFIWGLQAILGAGAACIAMAIAIEALLKDKRFSDDTVIGVIGHAALAGALIGAVYLKRTRVDFLGYLFGDIFSMSWDDVTLIAFSGVFVLLPIIGFWRPLILATAEPEIAKAEGIPIHTLSFAFAVLLAVVVSLGLRAVGALLIIALLVMPAAAARRLSRTPFEMVVLSTILSMITIVTGVVLSFNFNWPGGPAITLAAVGLFAVILPFRR